jgi:hypothetical protein
MWRWGFGSRTTAIVATHSFRNLGVEKTVFHSVLWWGGERLLTHLFSMPCGFPQTLIKLYLSFARGCRWSCWDAMLLIIELFGCPQNVSGHPKVTQSDPQTDGSQAPSQASLPGWPAGVGK